MPKKSCSNCRFFYRYQTRDVGECLDPAKRIFSPDGKPARVAPRVQHDMYCANHSAPAEKLPPGTPDPRD